jgi:hypothetical protein
VARARVAACIDTVHVVRAPRHAPLHERSFQPLAGVAVSRTGLKEGNAAEHLGRQVMPARELRTAPLPATATVSRNEAGANKAVTAAPGATVTAQAAEPEHDPLQR